ncbi:MAG TPA: hypothetical protein VG758_32450, partial [Hyphomicrobiaceae bacterium]|nr:hypothetical protein [Hyphomicrobiaceae bacterium]
MQQFGKDVAFNLQTGEILSGTSLPPQTFGYQADALGKTFQAVAASSAWCPDVSFHQTGDFNGDGRTDRVCLWQRAEVALATETGFATPQVWMSQDPGAVVLVGDYNG